MFQLGAINISQQSNGSEIYTDLYYVDIVDVQKYLKVGIQFKYQKNVCVMVFEDNYSKHLDIFFEALKILTKKFAESKPQIVESNFNDKFPLLKWPQKNIVFNFKMDLLTVQKPQEKLILESDEDEEEN